MATKRTAKKPQPSADAKREDKPASLSQKVYGGISNDRVEQLRHEIRKDFHAEEAARELISHAKWCIASGQQMPEKLRNLVLDGLWNLQFKDPLGLFGHIRPEKKKGRGNRRKESDYEWLNIMRDILRIYDDEGIPLASPGAVHPKLELTTEGTAFLEYAKRHIEGNDHAVSKEARRLQAGFWKHVKQLPAAQIDSLGLSEYLPRANS
ncbi:MAG: hypothetical protein QM769_12070 [Pseudoxanthomonas sp.]